jgi:cytochrome c553
MMRALTGIAVALALAATSVQAADIAAGKAKVEAVCSACHGIDGNSIAPDFPRLAGQHPKYLAKALRDYRSGKRKNAIMAPMAATLTPAEMEDVIAYYSSLPTTLTTKY